ncbi:RNA-guided endonuclease IscB [Baaleninema simplex]|uniref:RNA-guided endonuclease IscB n=1 Tax=Baaleninema simplex TaxID=2862350 RepID=UPI0004766B43|nr:RNA-guided endonuclease IscB [Baaleninema simplex]
MSNFVFVLDTNRQPLTPCHPARARELLAKGKAAVYRRYPFTIVLNRAVGDVPPESQLNASTPLASTSLASTSLSVESSTPLRLKIDPGSQTTGLAVVNGNQLVWGAELQHRGDRIQAKLETRRVCRRNRRNRQTRYRKPRFLNRTRPKGWLPPSLNASAPLSVESERSRGLNHRVKTTLTWVNRLRKLCPIASISQELVRFDTQKLQNPEISGAEYQQGELFGYEVREYLLEKWGRKCAYCSTENVPLEVEHIHPKSKGGNDRISNLTLACRPCNQSKGNRNVREFLSGKPSVLDCLLRQAKAPLKDAAAVNATRWKLYQRLKETGLPVEVGTGGQTKFNRTRLELPKAHWLDAACVGETPSLHLVTETPMAILSKGRPTRFRTLIDRYGFPRAVRKTKAQVNGLQAGDIVRATVPNGKYRGQWTGAIAGVREKRPPALRPFGGKQLDLTAQTQIHVIHKQDGYEYGINPCGHSSRR